MNKLLEPYCRLEPRWVQIELQAFTYGFLCWASDCIESSNGNEQLDTLSPSEYLEGVDPHFAEWPSEWLEDVLQELVLYCILEKHMTIETIQKIYGEAEDVFRDYIPTDLMIFTQLATGNSLSEEQWERLYDTIAFQPPDNSFVTKPGLRNKTLRTHGRRAITPMKRSKYRGKTVHKRHSLKPIFIIKES